VLCITNLLEYFLFVTQCSDHNDGGDVIVIYINNIIYVQKKMLVENETIYLQRIVHSHNTDNNDGYDEILKLKKKFRFKDGIK